MLFWFITAINQFLLCYFEKAFSQLTRMQANVMTTIYTLQEFADEEGPM